MPSLSEFVGMPSRSPLAEGESWHAEPKPCRRRRKLACRAVALSQRAKAGTLDVFRGRSAFAKAPARQPSLVLEHSSLSELVGMPSRSPLAEGEGWWRRRESNPRPKSLSAGKIHVQSSSGSFTPGAQNGQNTPKASPMILWLQHGPRSSHQPTE